MNKEKEFFELYNQLSGEQKDRLFGKEERQMLDTIAFLRKMFNDSGLYKEVEQVLGERAYYELRLK